MSKMKCKRLCVMLTLSLLLVCMMGTTAFAAGTGDVAGAVESTWTTASTQILRCFSSPNSAQLILTTERVASSSGRLPPSCSRASCSR